MKEGKEARRNKHKGRDKQKNKANKQKKPIK